MALPLPTRNDSPVTRIIAVDTALPRLRVSQKEALRFILKNFDLRPGTRAFYRRVFAHESVKVLSKLKKTLLLK
jgi:2-hydroxy-3-keto-5-methylthiopentenyl-1-phosphate phosphatase